MGLESREGAAQLLPPKRKEMQRLLNEAMDGRRMRILAAATRQRIRCRADVDGNADADRHDGRRRYPGARRKCLRESRRRLHPDYAGGGPAIRCMKVKTSAGATTSSSRSWPEVAQRPILHNIVVALDDQPDFHTKELAWVHDLQCSRVAHFIGQGRERGAHGSTSRSSTGIFTIRVRHGIARLKAASRTSCRC